MYILAAAALGPSLTTMHLCTSGFVDNVIFSHTGPNTATDLGPATQQIVHRDSPDGAAKLHTRGRSLLSPIAFLSNRSMEINFALTGADLRGVTGIRPPKHATYSVVYGRPM